ncbi:MAG: hypothetical protein AAFV53_14885, partial [Myxococcota bacterium]
MPAELLRAHLHRRAKILMARTRPANPSLNGYVVGLSEALVMVHAFHDFLPDGYSVVRTDDVADVRSG